MLSPGLLAAFGVLLRNREVLVERGGVRALAGDLRVRALAGDLALLTEPFGLEHGVLVDRVGTCRV